MNRPAMPSLSVPQQMRAAVAAFERRDFEAAESRFEALTRTHPEFPDAWHYWGLMAHQQGHKAEALERFARAQALDPDNLVFLLNFGRALREQGDFMRSIGCLERAHELAPDHAQVVVQLGQSLLAIERGGELISEIERHMRWAGHDWHLWMLLGECRAQHRDTSGALAAFDEAANLAPAGETGPYLRRADVSLKAEDVEDTRRNLERVLRIDAASAEARVGLANLAAQNGDFEQAETLARESLALNPHMYLMWDLLANLYTERPPEHLAAELEAAAAKVGENDPRAWPLHFARGRVLERLGDYDKAFAAYAAGNRIRAAMRLYSRERQTDYNRDFISALDASFVNRAERIGIADSPVIFVCGMPRSGTTLVETILASHPAVTPGGEQRYVHDLLRQRLGSTGMARTGSWLRNLGDDELGKIAGEWHRHLLGKARSHRYVTDKLPGNYAMMGLVHVCFPAAPIIHVRRDRRDTCFSCYALSFAEGHSFSYALDTVGHYYRLYESLVAHWKRVLPSGRIIEVEYEKLVHEPETEVRRLLDALGLEWDPRCLAFHETARTVATASVFQVRRPLYTSSIGRWKRFERHLGPLLAELEGSPPI